MAEVSGEIMKGHSIISMRFRLLATILAVLASSCGARAQAEYPPETRNAALRYWAAIAAMKELPNDAATQKVLNETLTGQASWSEKALGSILDAMQKRLEECNEPQSFLNVTGVWSTTDGANCRSRR